MCKPTGFGMIPPVKRHFSFDSLFFFPSVRAQVFVSHGHSICHCHGLMIAGVFSVVDFWFCVHLPVCFAARLRVLRDVIGFFRGKSAKSGLKSPLL